MIFEPPKTIYMVSPQPWDGIKVSKHHYAIELARLGHRVFYIEPPRTTGGFGEVQVLATEVEGVRRVSYRPWFPYWIKFRARMLFDHGMRLQARLIAQRIGKDPDIVWDFDNSYQFADLRAFGLALKIFHPVDELAAAQHGDKHADLLFSVSQLFIDQLDAPSGEVRLLPHGINRTHAAYAEEVLRRGSKPVRQSGRPLIGYVGHLDHPEFDWETTFALIEANPSLDFVFIGPYSSERSGQPTPAARLLDYPNCQLTGLLSLAEMLQWADRVDIWTMIFRSPPGVGGVIDAHKLLEYLATGKAILTTRVLPYIGSDLFYMAGDDTNRELSGLLEQIVADLGSANSPANQRRRCEFALEHTYLANLRKVDAAIVGWSGPVPGVGEATREDAA